jgi:hypothetical protein
MDLTNASAIVTGGAGGLGSATVRRLAQKGAKVVIADVSDERSEALAREVGSGSLYVLTDRILKHDVYAALELADFVFVPTSRRHISYSYLLLPEWPNGVPWTEDSRRREILALRSRGYEVTRMPPWFSSRADRGFVRRPAQKRDTRKFTLTPRPFLLPCRDHGPAVAGKLQNTSLAALSHGLERGKPACRMVHLYPAPQHVVCGVPA